MIRLTWRQFRGQAIGATVVLAALAVVVASTGVRLLHFYDTNVVTCHATGDCRGVTTVFLGFDHVVQAALGPILLVLPAVAGIFWGAPLVARELETGTYRLAWTQSETRDHWLAVRLTVTGLTAITATGLVSLMVTWWFSPLDHYNLNRFTPAVFGERGITPIGYAAFAFVLGVTAGVLIRRTVPAMAVTLVGYTAARLAATYWIRPHLFTPVRVVASAAYGASINQADWVLSSTVVTAAGRVLPHGGELEFDGTSAGVSIPGAGRCPNIPAGSANGQVGPGAYNACIQHFGLRQITVYQPISRYWPFQGAETAIFLAAALALAGFCFWWVRHRLA